MASYSDEVNSGTITLVAAESDLVLFHMRRDQTSLHALHPSQSRAVKVSKFVL